MVTTVKINYLGFLYSPDKNKFEILSLKSLYFIKHNKKGKALWDLWRQAL